MSAGEMVQTVSLLLVALALLISVLQLRQMERQSTAAMYTMGQMAYDSMNQAYSSYRVDLMKDDPDLLAWHLRISGYPVGSPEMNRRTLFLMGKLDAHERNVINHRLGLLSEDAWRAWASVLEGDTALPEFATLWPAARRFYAPSLVEEVERIIASKGSGNNT